MPSIVVYVPFHSPATTTFQESQMSRDARISPQIRLKSDTNTLRASSKLAFISLIIHRAALCFLLQSQCSSRHTPIKSLRDYTQYNLVIIHRKQNLLLFTSALHRQAANTLGKFLFCRRGTHIKGFLSERIVHSNHI